LAIKQTFECAPFNQETGASKFEDAVAGLAKEPAEIGLKMPPGQTGTPGKSPVRFKTGDPAKTETILQKQKFRKSSERASR
jgi:hypothetical protein